MFVSFLDGEVRQVLVLITQVLQGELTAAKLQIGGGEHVDVKRVPRGHKHPLSDVKFSAIYEKGVFNVLLNDLGLTFLAWLDYVFDLVGTVNS